MQLFGHRIARRRTVNAVLTLALIVLFGLQPGFFAAASASGMHDASMSAQMSPENHDLIVSGSTSHDSHGASSESATEHHDQSQKMSDKSCEIHCAPVTGLNLARSDDRQILRDSFGRAADVAALFGHKHEFIKPPRT